MGRGLVAAAHRAALHIRGPRKRPRSKPLLVPTEVTKLSERAGRTGIERAHALRARIEIAQGRACDLIVMASDGRRGIAGLLVGSQTQHVLTHGSVPVLVSR